MKHLTDAYLIENLKLQLLNTSFREVDNQWNYRNITSPFTRIFYIKSGKGYILPNNEMHELKPGYLYLIPSFTPCSYHCTESLSLYYLHFTNESSEGFKIFDFLNFSNEVKSSPIDETLFEQLISLNKFKALKHQDPTIYEKENWANNPHRHVNGKYYLETSGIMRQLLSRFITETKINNKDLQHIAGLKEVIKHIHSHLDEELSLDKLANIACYSSDHFSRLFQRTIGYKPVEYINKKRIEKAQILLLTSGKSQDEISYAIGFKNTTYYYRIFKKMVGCTPVKYRQMGGLV